MSSRRSPPEPPPLPPPGPGRVRVGPSSVALAPFNPGERERRTVETMAVAGVPLEEIARCLGVSARTVRRHFPKELDTARIRALAGVASTLFQAAQAALVHEEVLDERTGQVVRTGRVIDIRRSGIDAAKFIAATQMGWTTKEKDADRDDRGEPPPVLVLLPSDSNP